MSKQQIPQLPPEEEKILDQYFSAPTDAVSEKAVVQARAALEAAMPPIIHYTSFTHPSFGKLWLDNESDLESYVDALRNAWSDALRNGKTIDIS